MIDPLKPLLASVLTFGEPGWWWALLAVPVLLALYLRARRLSAAAVARVLAPRLRALLSQSIPGARRNVRFALLLLAFACFTAALTRPQYGFDSRDIKRKGLDVIIAVDTSKSMLAADIEPNRLARAKLAALDLLALCRGDRLGVIAFAGRAFLMAPLTIDYGAVVNSIRELDTEVIPRGGTNLSEAVQLSTEAFGKGEGADKVLVFLTDGEDVEGDALTQVKKAADAGVKIYCVGIGSTEGSLLPLPGGQFIRDRSGQLVRSRLDEGKLREVAQAGGGLYVRLDGGPAVMESMYRNSISKLRAGETESKTTQRPIQRFMWPLAVGVLALLGGLFVPERRRNGKAAPAPRRATAVAALLLCALLPTAEAASGRAAMKEYRDGKYEAADNSFSDLVRERPESPRLQFNLGASAYQRKEYRRAAEAFGRALAGSPETSLKASSHYNLGNTLFRQGESQKDGRARIRDWQDALKHYDASLDLDPTNPDARANRDLVRRLLQQAKEQQKKGKKDKKKQEDGEEGEEGDESDGDPQQDKQKKKKKKKKEGDEKKEGEEQSEDGEEGDEPPEDEGDNPSNERQDEEGGAAPDEKERQERRERAERNAPEQQDQSKEGDLQARGAEEKKDEKGEPKTAQAGEVDPSRDGRLSPGQARRLLEALKGEDDRVILTDRPRRTEPVFKDW